MDSRKPSQPRLIAARRELSRVLGISPNENLLAEVRIRLNEKIIEVVTSTNLTHEQVATLSGASRTRVTALLNRKLDQVSTDHLLRILSSLGTEISLTFTDEVKKS